MTGVVELVLERVRENRQIEIAKRLVNDELHTVWCQLDSIAKAGITPNQMTPGSFERFLPTSMW